MYTCTYVHTYVYVHVISLFTNLQAMISVTEEKLTNNGSLLMIASHTYTLPLCCLVNDEIFNESAYTIAVPLMILAVTLSILLTCIPLSYHTISTVLVIPLPATALQFSVTD